MSARIWRELVGWPYVCATRVRWFSHEALELDEWLHDHIGGGNYQVRGVMLAEDPDHRSLALVGTLDPGHHLLVTMTWA